MISRRTTRLVAAVSLVAVVALPGTVLGHAELMTVTPADQSTVSEPPAEIVMTFTEDLNPGRSTIRLVDAAGAVVAEGGQVDPGDDVRTMRLALREDLAPGTYTIRWTSFSTQDNEQDRGTTTFTSTASTAPPTIGSAIASAAPSPSAAPPSTVPAASTSDALIPIVFVLVALVGLGLWLVRGRSGRGA